MTLVIDLRNPANRYYYLCGPSDAVIAAYAQANGDWNTWDYASKYSDLLVYGQHSVSCGDFCALLEVENVPSNRT